jgi:hypothetical protein
MGAIFRARDRLSGNVVALKLLHSQGDDGDEHERFAREAEVLAELRHPSIVGHIAHGRTPQGLRFLAMEWLDGEDLSQRLARGPLEVADALVLAQHVAEALAFAHRLGVIHRDLKPTNLYLPGGDIRRVKVLDFGIARRLGKSAKAITRTGMLVGTPEYMAPEQARGSADVTGATDLFALGSVLYECIAGEPPFVGAHVAAVLTRILFEEPTPIEERRPGLPGAVSALLARMLTKDPKKRIQDGEEVAACLASIDDVPSLPLMSTILVGSKPTPPSTPGGGEKSLLSIVVAQRAEGRAESDTLADVEQHEGIVGELRAVGAQADLLIGGSLIAAMPQMHSARDQATHAARVAIMIQDQWPDARIAVVTGKGSRSQGLITGEVLDRAWSLHRTPPTPKSIPSTDRRRILMDDVSADLLDTRFEMRPITGGFSLESERLADDATRLLLGRPTPCVGRERELGILEGVLTECIDESVARGVVVTAPAGLGKSRLRHEFIRRLDERETAPLVLFGRGDAMKVKSSYGVLGAALRQHCQIREEETLTDQQDKLRREVTASVATADSQRALDFLGELCGIPFPDANRPQLRAARQDPRIMSDLVEQAWLDWLRATMDARPVVLVVEDVHHADALTIKLCQSALRALPERPLMVLATARPELSELYPDVFRGAWQQIALQPLPKRAGERLVRQILGSDVSPSVVSRLIEQSTGNPLFLEELIRATAERKTDEIPQTVSAMLQARIGRLSARERKTLRAASVFGETFWEAGVGAMLGDADGPRTLELALAELVKGEIIEERRERRFANAAEYRFRHGLMRDAAYGLLSEQEALSWHTVAAAFLESVGEREAVVLAEHYRLGMQKEKAAEFYTKAAEQAFEAHDHDASQSCADRGLECGVQGARRGELLSVLITNFFWRGQLGQVLQHGASALELAPAGGHAWCRAVDAYFSTALITGQMALLPGLMQQTLATEPNPESRSAYARALAWPSVFFYILGQKEPAELLLQRQRQVCATLDADDEALSYLEGAEANRTEQGIKLPYTNMRFNEAATNISLAAGNRRLQSVSAVYYGKSWHDLGDRTKAERILRENVILAEVLKDEHPLAYCKIYLARLLATGSDAERDEADRLAGDVLNTQNPTVLGLAHGVLAQTAWRRGDLARAEQEARAACEVLVAFPPYRLDMIALRSRILSEQGHAAESLRICEEMVQQIEALGLESYGLVDLYVALAEARARSGDAGGARSVLEKAASVLRRRADDIPDAQVRAVYLSDVPENKRLFELASEWNVATGL